MQSEPSTQRSCKRNASQMSSRSTIISDRIQRMMKTESSFRNSAEQIEFAIANASLQNQVWREQVAQWCYDIVDHLNAPRDVVYTAMNIVDRFIVRNVSCCSMDKKEYECIAVTSLFLATRISGVSGIKVPELLTLSRSTLRPQQILSTGTRILESLSWESKIIPPQAFLKAFIALLPPTTGRSTVLSWFELSMYLVEISVCDGRFSNVSASQIAFSALLVAMQNQAADKRMVQYLAGVMKKETSIDFRTSCIQRLCVRLQNIYSQSHDTSETNGPNVIEVDEEEISTSATTRLDSEGDQLNVIIRPVSPIREVE